METRALKLFLQLAESLHFGRASEVCHISPSTLSRNIKQLEEDVGVTLFERDNRTVTLTKEGQLFEEYAKATLAQWDLFRSALEQEGEQLTGEISIYCTVTASYSFLYELLSRFRQHHPKIEIKLHTGDADGSIPRILNEQADIAIAARPDKLPANLSFQQIAISPLVFIAPAQRGELQAKIARQPLAELPWQELPMIVSEKGVFRKRVDQWFRHRGIKPRIYAQVAGNEAIVSMVGLGFGVGVVPKIVLDNSPLADQTRILDVQPPLPPFEVGLCALKKRIKNPLVHALWTQAGSSFGELS